MRFWCKAGIVTGDKSICARAGSKEG
jgi:hypothetical protein